MKAFGDLLRMLWWRRPKHFSMPDPVFPGSLRKSSKPRKPRKRLGAPPCDPGTITYRDWLVRHVGYDRRLADRMLKAWRADSSIRLPLPSDSKTLKGMMS